MAMKGWYKKLLLTWAVVGLPIIILGIGFSGGNIQVPSLRSNPKDFVLWIIVTVLLLSPLIMVPFGLIKKKRHGGHEGGV
jgi:hypothetical protein